jgi:hypothetical protein
LFFILHIENNTPQHSFLKACDQNEKTYWSLSLTKKQEPNKWGLTIRVIQCEAQ